MRTGATFTVDVELVTETCCNCGMAFAMTADYRRRRKEDHRNFYCPAGHPQFYTAESEAEKMRCERDRAQQQLARAEDERKAAEAAAHAARMREAKERKAKNRIVTRVQGGACPHCNRTFANMARHMASKHGGLPATRHLVCGEPEIGDA